MHTPLQIAVIGAGWAGLSAALGATDAGHRVTLFEATATVGGRAKALPSVGLDGYLLDNGQHILIGAYTETLRLMRKLGLQPADLLLELPLTLCFPDQRGLRLPNWPAPLDALAGVASARGWSLADKASLLGHMLRWRWQGFQCDADLSVAGLCQGLSARIQSELIEPLCVSALNTPATHASASVFLRVLHDALLGPKGASHLLLPRTHLSALFADAASQWLVQRGCALHLSERVQQIAREGSAWRVQEKSFDAVIVACSASHAVQLLNQSLGRVDDFTAAQLTAWNQCTDGLRFESIATLYAHATQARLAQPMLALRSSATAPAQFVFDRGQLGGPAGLLAFVVSASHGDRALLQAQVLTQAQAQLGLCLHPIQTVVEKRATFACTPALIRPSQRIAPALLACGDYVAGPYPATLEGAVRSGLGAAAVLKAL